MTGAESWTGGEAGSTTTGTPAQTFGHHPGVRDDGDRRYTCRDLTVRPNGRWCLEGVAYPARDLMSVSEHVWALWAPGDLTDLVSDDDLSACLASILASDW